jgi:cobalt-zinc-cadmium efflux system outer membrane protein
LLFVSSLAAGCVPASAVRQAEPPPPAVVRTPATAPDIAVPVLPPCAPELPDGPVSLGTLLDFASERHPDLAAARARAGVARGRLVQASLYPNPVLTWEADEMHSTSDGAGTQGPIFAQTILTAGKRPKGMEAASHGVVAADWQVITRCYDVQTRLRLAYFEALTAQGEVRQSLEAVRINVRAVQAACKRFEAGTGARPDILRAEAELDQSRARLAVARERAAAAWRGLATATGVPSLPEHELQGNFDEEPPTWEYPSLLDTILTRSSELQEALAAAAQADAAVVHAEAVAVPDVNVAIRPFYAFTDQTYQMRVEVGAALPIFNRNQGNIASARADAARLREEIRRTELSLTDRLTSAYRRYQSAREQAEAYRKKIRPAAEEAERLITGEFERGDPKFDFTSVLEAQRTLIAARLGEVQARGDMWRAISEIVGLLQPDGDCCGPVPR